LERRDKDADLLATARKNRRAHHWLAGGRHKFWFIGKRRQRRRCPQIAPKSSGPLQKQDRGSAATGDDHRTSALTAIAN